MTSLHFWPMGLAPQGVGLPPRPLDIESVPLHAGRPDTWTWSHNEVHTRRSGYRIAWGSIHICCERCHHPRWRKAGFTPAAIQRWECVVCRRMIALHARVTEASTLLSRRAVPVPRPRSLNIN